MECKDIDEFVKKEFLNTDKFVKFIEPEEFIIVEKSYTKFIKFKI